MWTVGVGRDKGTPRDAAPSHTTGHTGTNHDGSIRLRLGRDMETGETGRLEVLVAEGLLDRRVS